MSMSPVPDDFEQLRRLLALKKHEQPPPGYFHGFSRQVIVRIKAGEAGDEVEASFWSFGNGSLFQRIWATLDARPILAGAFGVAVCGFFVVGALISENGTATEISVNLPPRISHAPVAAAPVWQNANIESSSLVGVVPAYRPTGGSLFDEIKAQQFGSWQASPQSVIPKAVPVSFPQ
jgi:hypothetical protein